MHAMAELAKAGGKPEQRTEAEQDEGHSASHLSFSFRSPQKACP